MRGNKHHFQIAALMAILVLFLTGEQAAAQHETILYNGTTYTGGAYGTTNNGGTVYELTPQSGGGWSQRVIHSFGSGTDGALPHANVILDTAGNLYGTTAGGGAHDMGTVFELIHQSGGAYREKILHSFTGGVDGAGPGTGLVFDSVGNLYGSTGGGGAHSGGVVFELIPQSNGTYQEKVLHSFRSRTDGSVPICKLTLDI